jgi:glycosyltransferase involved in cell wall biosynthesis
MENLSVVILTYNEERNITRCIESVLTVASEIVVVDSFSTDRTAEICRSYPMVRFVQHPFGGYIEQKNYARSLAVNRLVLSLDADEALSDLLKASIRNVLSDFRHDGYTMNRLTNYCGNWIRYSGWYPDRKLRLFDNRKGHWGGVNPHDKFILDKGSTTGHLKGDLLHYSYYSRVEHKNQVRRFADISAHALHERGVKSNLFKIWYKPVARFIKTYFVKRGFLDGANGWHIARMTALASYLRYHNLYRLSRKR